MRILLSLLIIALYATVAHADIYVLCYHSFLGKKQVNYDFSNDELRAHLRFLADRGFRFISLRDIQEGRVNNGKNVLVTIDDGNHSVYRAYYDVFRPMGVKPLLSIYPNIIGKKEYALNWQQLKQLSNDGCEIASHGYFHLKLNNKLHSENKSYFMQEIVKSKKVLEEKLGISVTSFVYPFGLNTDVAEAALRKTGYQTAFTIVNNPVKHPLSRNPNIMKLPRYMLTRSHFQGSLNHIAAIAEKGSKAAVASQGTPWMRGLSPIAVNGPGKTELRRKHAPQQAVALRKNGGKRSAGDLRYGVAYEHDRVTEKSHSTNGKKKRKKVSVRKKELTTAYGPEDRKVAVLPEPVKAMPADQVLNYNRISGIGIAHAAMPSKSVKQAGAGDQRANPAPTPGSVKHGWNIIARDVMDFYHRVIQLQFQKAARYLQRVASIIRS